MRRQLAFDRAVARAVATLPDRAVRVGVSAVVTGVGVGLGGVLVARLLEQYVSPVGLIFGGIAPLALSLAVATGGLLIYWCDLRPQQNAHMGIWWAVGAVVSGTAGLAIVIFEASNGATTANPEVIVAGNAATGGLGGLVVGWYDARRLSVAAERERERQRLADEREKLALVNRIVHHDIGNDLQVVAGTADVLERYVTDDGAEALERLQRTTGDAIDLTDQVRAFVSTLDGDAEELRPIALKRIVRTQVDNLRERYPEATVTVAKPIPDVAVRADELLSTVLGNLLSNAVDHNDSLDPHVIVDVDAKPDTVALRVEDDGPGIPKEHQETLFDRGELGPDSDGTGLGLYIVDMLIDRYGGTIEVEDRTDARGTAFVIELNRA